MAYYWRSMRLFAAFGFEVTFTFCNIATMNTEKNTISINPERLYTKKEYCKYKGISRPTLDRWIKEKREDLTVIKINGATLIKS